MAGRPSKTPEDYQKLAQVLGLKLTGTTPKSVYENTTWECLTCGRVHIKSYHHYKYAENGCRCQSQKGLKREDYQSLAEQLKIKWVGELLPQNAHSATQWIGVEDRPFEATYSELAYPERTPARLFLYIPRAMVDRVHAAKEEKKTKVRVRLAQL